MCNARCSSLPLSFAALILGAIAVARVAAQTPEVKALAEPDPAREERIVWHKQARFGGFVHWGVYSALENEWEGKPGGTYAEHIMRVKKIPRAVYLEKVAKRFNPEKFDADAWIKLMHQAGMRYFIITAKHHDGFALWPSAVSEFDLADASQFKRDPMRELKDACKKYGLYFGFYYSHAFDWEHPDAPGNDWDYKNPGGDLLLHGGANWFDRPSEYIEKARRYVDEKSIPQILELLRNYDPDILWFDTPHKLSPAENMRILKAIRTASPRVVVNGRLVRSHGDYKNTGDRPAEVAYTDGHWEGIPTTNESYGYSKFDHSHKSPGHFVQLLAKMVSKGGNMLMNVGPKGDGTIDETDRKIFTSIGDWMRVNGESIWGCERTPLAVQNWGTSTLKGNRLYLHVFEWPKDGKLVLAGVKNDPRSARLLSDPTRVVSVKRTNPLDLELSLPASAPDAANSVVVLEFSEPLQAQFSRLLTPGGAPTTLHVFDGKLAGKNIGYMDGKRNRDVTTNWSQKDSGVDWPVRVTEARKVRIRINYASPGNMGGSFQIRFGRNALEGMVKPRGKDAALTTLDLGDVELPVGEYTVSIRPLAITGDAVRQKDDPEKTPGEIAADAAGRQLMHLRQIELIPVQ